MNVVRFFEVRDVRPSHDGLRIVAVRPGQTFSMNSFEEANFLHEVVQVDPEHNPTQVMTLGVDEAPRTMTEREAFEFGVNVSDLQPGTLHPLPTASEERKAIPLATGVLDYFPAALAEVAKVSKAGNDKHNPGEPLHWSRGKSTDQADAIARHLLERGGIDPETGQRFSAQLAWRALALLQIELEEAGEAPLSRGSSINIKEAS